MDYYCECGWEFSGGDENYVVTCRCGKPMKPLMKKTEPVAEVPCSDGLCPVVSLRDYTPADKIKHVTFSRMEIEQVYECATCGPLQVVDGVCMHIKPEEDHEWVE